MSSSKKRRYCCYRGCYSVKRLHSIGATSTSFFSFPVKDTERCSKWISNCGREEFRYLTPRELAKERICELHFDPRMFSNDFKTDLVRNAVPIDCRKSSTTEEVAVCDDEDYAERESGINTAESSDNNENELNELHSAKESSILSVALVKGKKSLRKKKDSEMKYLSPEYINVDGSNYSDPAIARNEKYSNNINKISNSSEVSSRNSTKFHNLPPQTTHTDFYYQQCQSAEETNNSFPEPADGELPLFIQQEYGISEAEDPINNSVVSEPSAKKVKYDKDNSDLANLVKETVKQLKHITSTVVTNSEDEFEVFGRSVAIQLKKMSLCTALTVQSKIQDLLSQYRIKDINKAELKSVSDSDKRFVNVNREINNCLKDMIEKPSDKKESDDLQPTSISPQHSLSLSQHSDSEMVE